MVRRREFLGSMAALASQAPETRKRRPNVLLIISDDQGFGDLSIHGNLLLKTPNIDRIGREGVHFTQFHASPVCSPTRASLMTGRYNYRTGVVDTYLGRSMMYPDEVTMPELLSKAGYRTGIFGKWHLGDNYPLRPIDQGFQTALVHRGGGIGQPSDIPGGSYFDPMLLENGRVVKKQGYCTDVFFDSAMEFIDKNLESPWFAYVAPNAPHDPLQVDDRYVHPFRRPDIDERTAKVYGMVRNLDENVGRMLAKLDERQIAKDTVVLFMTDNGPQRQRYNAGMRGLKGSVYQGGIRVPLLMRWSEGLAAGRVVDRIAAHIDLLPTILNLCGAPPAANIDGKSLYPLINNSPVRINQDPWPDRSLFFQWHRGDEPVAWRNAAVRTQRWKLVNSTELYDLEADPGEANDVAGKYPQVVARMRRDYDRWFNDVCSTRGFAPPRIVLDGPENPVTLTRQDWRGPKAGWAPDSLGHWEVSVERAGKYEVVVKGGPLDADGSLSLSIGQASAILPLKKGETEWKAHLSLGNGPMEVMAKLEVSGEEFGPTFVDIRRL
ncbi:MAG TPA: arylsulfatase [Bryobacteraceae bacterium]|nr:arylsulfatase [Bryobacteraceae bacterium]